MSDYLVMQRDISEEWSPDQHSCDSLTKRLPQSNLDCL